MTRRTGRATIALWNSYDPNSFREAHRRVLARAGPLALAFDMNLATFGFPFPKDLPTPQEIADWVATTTSIGEDGSYLRELASKGRFQTFPYMTKGLPPQLGESVLTTCDPDAKRKRSAEEVVLMLKEGRSVCLLFGTGPKGVPKEAREMAPNHMDITFGGHSLETCTALGAVAAVIAHALRRQGKNG
ncbi:MAG: DUF531 domain-containing protein [Methanomassiliicoccales archaeon]|jgi:hypothetical protein|nr:DUF531 domain-containing protein [Methanomassiliicoccales archaeon]MDD1755910.1 DUF531 domain-containing protein [Methanomassiliicoccales archaeon]